MDKEELKPCPFCGGEAENQLREVRCIDCGASINASYSGRAVHNWNARNNPLITELRAENARLKQSANELMARGVELAIESVRPKQRIMTFGREFLISDLKDFANELRSKESE